MSCFKVVGAVLFAGTCFFSLPSSHAEDAGIPASWRTEWDSPSAAMRPLQIVHGFVGHYDTPEKMAYFKDECGLGGIVCNVGPDNYLYNDTVWKSFVNAVKSAKSLGLRVWIYDEDGYPSPEAGGVVLRGHPEFECMALVYDKDRADEPFYVRPAYEFTHAANNFAAARRYPNLLHSEATRRFLEVTHQQYRDRLGEELFNEVEAFFTDEPSLNAVNIGQIPEDVRKNVRIDDPLDPDLKPLPMVPWCDDLPERYREKYGQDLIPLRKSLFVGDSDDDKQARQRFWSLVGELTRDRFYGQIQQWCQGNGSSVPTADSPNTPLRLASSGHTLHEEPTHAHVPLDGNKLEVLMRMDVPGLDMLASNPKHAVWGAWRAAAFPASAAWWTNRRLVMTEISDFSEKMGGSGPVDLKTMCAAAAWQAAMGVTEFTLYYVIKDRDEATHKMYCDYVGRLNAILRSAKPVYDVILYYPITELQAEYLPMAEPLNLQKLSPKTRECVANFENSGRMLLERQIPFVIVDKKPENAKLFVQTVENVKNLPVAGLPKIAPENTWIILGRFERDGRDIFLLLNADDVSYEGKLSFPSKDSPGRWDILNPVTGEISSLDAVAETAGEVIPVKLRSKQALIYIRDI